MKIKFKAGVILPILFAGLVLGAIPTSIQAIRQSKAAETGLFEEQYITGDEIIIPDVELGGVTAEKYIIYPNGRTYSRDSFVPEDIGYYTVKYVTDSASQEHSFYVAGKKYYIEGVGNAYYGTTARTPSKETLNVTLGANSKFYFDEIININEMGKKNLIEFFPMASNPGSVDANTIKIRFTDVYDSSKYLQYEIDASRQGASHPAVYMRAGGENQTPTGIETHSGKIFTGTIFGYAYTCSMYCCNQDGSALNETQLINNRIGLGFDPKSYIATSLPNEQGSNFIVDLNDSKFFSEFWRGLTTGEAQVSIWFENMVSSEATICITSIGGKELSTTTIKDDGNPNLAIDDLFGQLPNAIINQKYRFYEATSTDAYSGNLNTEIHVYRDYYGKKVEVAKTADGFIPTRLGKYYIEYTAKDYSNNVTTKLYEVNCVNETTSYDVTLNPGYRTSGYVGEIITLATANVSGSTGLAKGQTFVLDPNNNKSLITDGQFVPSTTGKHKVSYVYEDFVGTIEEISYDLDVTVSAAPIMNEVVTLLPYYIAEYEYELPGMNGVDYNVSSDAIVAAEITAIDGESIVKGNGNKITFPSSSELKREVTVRYTCSNGNASEYREYKTTVITTSTDGFVHMENYFDQVNTTITPEKTSLELESDTSGRATFVNNLAINGFETNFSIKAGMSNFSKLNFYLVDSLNPEQTLKITWISTADGLTKTYVNDDTMFLYEGIGMFDGGLQSLKFDVQENRIQTNPNQYIPVKSYLNGEEFKGFTSDSVYLTIEFDNPSNNHVGISLTDINSQEMSNSKYDYIRPRIIMNGDYGGARDLNEIVTLCSASAYDVLDPNPTIDLTVTDMNNKVITDVNGNEIKGVSVEEEHKFKTTSYGSYRVSYHSKDYDENEVYFAYLITVYDKVAPTISLSGSCPTTAKVGDTVKFPSIKVSDNLTAKENIKTAIYVIGPTGFIYSTMNNSFKFTEEGKYIVRYVAIDEAGNTAYLDCVIEVSEVK